MIIDSSHYMGLSITSGAILMYLVLVVDKKKGHHMMSFHEKL